MRRILLMTVLLSPLAVAACQFGGGQDMAQTAPQGIEGRWNAIGGPVPYSASFNNGRFVSTERGSGATLASGTYSNVGPGQITIVYRPTTRDTEVAANCNQTAPNILSCATSSGDRFELQRA